MVAMGEVLQIGMDTQQAAQESDTDLQWNLSCLDQGEAMVLRTILVGQEDRGEESFV